MHHRYSKRLLDLVLTVSVFILFSPMLLLLALLLRLKLGSPVLFRQHRPGLNGKRFALVKFRTMTNDRDAEGNLLPDEDRLPAFGRFLRSTSLDEVPELINVLKGEMSVVGPRPLLMDYLDRYSPEQMRRHLVKPGLTGWAQVNGRNELSWEDKFAMDVWYVDHQSLWLDIRIIARTIWTILKRKGITRKGHATTSDFIGTQREPARQPCRVSASHSLTKEICKVKGDVMHARAAYWRQHYQHQHRQIDTLGLARSVELTNEKFHMQIHAHVLEGVGTAFGKSILDVGCGWGNSTLALHAYGGNVTGIDIVQETIHALRQKYPFISWEVIDLMDESAMSLLPQFDCVVATEVLEHVQFEPAMKSLWSHVLPRGRLVATVPNSECPILQNGLKRWNQPFLTHISPAQIQQIAELLADVEELRIKGLSFRDDQHFLPYSESDWEETVQGTPNRIIFSLIRDA